MTRYAKICKKKKIYIPPFEPMTYYIFNCYGIEAQKKNMQIL